MNICVDCGRVILGEAVTVAPGDSMSGARPDLRAHPPRSPECRPRERSRAELRRKLDASKGGGEAGPVSPAADAPVATAGSV